MMNFRLKEWDKPTEDYQFIGIRNDRNAFFLLSASGEKRCLLPYVLVPKGVRLSVDPFPECAPSEIRPCRLIPPPCRASAKEAVDATMAIIAANFSPWELAYGETLWPEPLDDPDLLERLAQLKSVKAEEYEERKKTLSTMTEPEMRRWLGGAKPKRLKRAKFRKYLAIRRAQLETAYTRKPNPHTGLDAGWLNATIQMVRVKNVGGLRDDYLHEKWARKNGFDLGKMKKDKAQFLQFCEDCVRNVVERENSAFFLNNDDAEILCASVRYVLIFADGTRIWLAKNEIRPLLDAREQDEFDRCNGESPKQISPEPVTDFTKLKLPSGKTIRPPRGAREILQALKNLGAQNVPCERLKREISRARATPALGEDYSPVKVLRGSAAGSEILAEGVIQYERHQRESIYSLRL